MNFNNYQFHFSDNDKLKNSEQTQEHIEQVLQETKELRLVRVAVDLSSQDKSISLLSASPNSEDIKTKVTEILQNEGIAVTDMMNMESLCHEDDLLLHIPKLKHSARNKKQNVNFFSVNSLDHKPENCPENSNKDLQEESDKDLHELLHEHSHEHSHKHLNEHSHEHSHEHLNEHLHEYSHGHSHIHPHGHSHDHSEGEENHWLKAAIGLIWGVGLLVLALGSFNIPIIAYYIITGLTTLMTLYLGRSVYQSAWNALLNKNWDTTTLYSISTLTIIGMSIASLFIPGLPMMFEAAPLVLGFWHLGEGIEHSLIDEINNKLDVRDCVPPLVTLKGKPNREISVRTLIPNDIILVKKGGVIPVDGVLKEKALLYTTRIDGSPNLKEFKPGDVVKAGMQLADHIPSLQMRVTKTYQNSYLSLIAKNINKANDEKAPVEVFANKILKYFIPALLAIALFSGILISIFFTPALAIQCVIAVLVSACPCALSIITPMAVKIGMKKASDHGIHFNNGKALQSAADIDTVVFDLNGTLTKGKIELEKLHISDAQFLNHIALLESQSDHPAAQIIKSYIEQQKVYSKEELVISSVDKSHHSGIKGVINGELFMIGNKDLLLDNGITHIDSPYNNPENGSIYIVREKNVIGQIALTDHLREDAIETVAQLKRLGKTVHICTGADKLSAEKYANLLGIPKENICANTVGSATKANEVSKSSFIKKLKQQGHKVAMVGDAANDIEAIAYADIGIAVKSSIGDEVTQQHSGIVVQQGLLFPIATAFDVAKKTKQNIIQNLIVSLTYNSVITLVAAGLLLAIGFALNPAIGVALMVLESTIVLANLYRFKRQEVVSSTPASKNTVQHEETTTHSTSKTLDALGYRSQLEPSATVTKDAKKFSVKSRGFFDSNKVSSSESCDFQQKPISMHC